jgi:CRISPR/Cas system CMR subunit Cmr4 (Cas7 group RAMP superfamily)
MKENFNKLSQKSGTEEEPAVNSEELVPGKSVVMSILEVVFCLLIQKVPTLNSSISGFHSTPTGTCDENDELIAETVKCLEMLPDICSDNGTKFLICTHKLTRIIQ